ncbi:bile salt sulfotransferase-like [Acanthaster planci]|uniref:Bile salt sulfotransferase-like n=1 Tax=Acanthaster planci TaxID=133434 RepID=A0A8B7ZMA1_ACAPL|nr:bile salt sulfotransferase-like [Acanthaster planci]
MENVTVEMEHKLPRPGVSKLDGLTWPWMVTRETLDAMKVFEVREDDVWVVTFPKSGTHWALEMANLILVDGHEHKINRAEVGHPAEFDYSIPGMSASSRRPQRTLPQYKYIQNWKAPRVVMSHLPEEQIPEQILQGKGKVVYVIRNPKDIVVSYWHFAVPWTFDKRYEDWECFFQMFLKGETIYGSWFDHTLNYWNKHRHDKNFLFLKYEDMKQDTTKAVIQMADFLDNPLSEESINRVVELTSVKSMKKRFDTSVNPKSPKDVPSAGSEITVDRAPSGPMTPEEIITKYPIGAPKLVRKGITGDWKSKLTVAQNEALDGLFREKMAGSGLTVRFE